MSVDDNPLGNLKVAAPCTADWGRMMGDERVRFCAQCSLNVYNLSGMTRGEAETLVANTEGRLCVRFFQRADGTILTENCPVGLRALKRRVSRVVNALASAVLGFFAGLGVNLTFSEMGKLFPPEERYVMGGIVAVEESPPTIPPEVDRRPVGSDPQPTQDAWVVGKIEYYGHVPKNQVEPFKGTQRTRTGKKK